MKMQHHLSTSKRQTAAYRPHQLHWKESVWWTSDIIYCATLQLFAVHSAGSRTGTGPLGYFWSGKSWPLSSGLSELQEGRLALNLVRPDATPFQPQNLDSLEGAGAHIKGFACTSLAAAPTALTGAHMEHGTRSTPINHPSNHVPWLATSMTIPKLLFILDPPCHPPCPSKGASQHSQVEINYRRLCHVVHSAKSASSTCLLGVEVCDQLPLTLLAK